MLLSVAFAFLPLLAALPSPKLVERSSVSPPVNLADCQRPKEQGRQLEGCPEGTIYVSLTDPQSDYGTVSAAIAALPIDNSSQTILIGEGTYHDVINITTPRLGPVTLLGVTWNTKSVGDNLVHVWNSSFINQTTQTATQHNSDAAVLTVDFPSNHTLSPGLFKAYNLNVTNRATWVNGTEAKGQTGPAAAVFFTWTNASTYECMFASYQDTLYIGRNSSVYNSGGEVKGGTDYLYGYGTGWWEGTTLANRATDGGLVAWKGTGQPQVKTVVQFPTEGNGGSLADGYTYGAYINRGKVVRSDDALPSLDLTGTRALGRPWNNASRVIYQDTFMDDIVLPAGFIEWQATDPRIVPNLTEFVEVGSYGPGFDLAARLNNSAIQRTFTSDAEAQGEVDGQKTRWSIKDVFGEQKPGWIDWDFVDCQY